MQRLLWLILVIPLVGGQTVEEVYVTLAASEEDAAQDAMLVSGLFIHWGTDTPYDATAQPEVLYSIDGGAQQRVAAQQVGSPADSVAQDPLGQVVTDVVYGAAITAAPGANVTYQVGEPTAGHDDERWVRMPPADELRVVAYADVGYDGILNDDEPVPLRVRDLAMAQDPDLVLIPGDIVYEDTNAGWDAWLSAMGPLFSAVPLMPVVGNHEPAGDYHQFKERFEVPKIPSGNLNQAVEARGYDATEEYYGFQAGPAYFVGVNSDGVCREDALGTANMATSEPPCEQGGQPDFVQYDWLHDILEDVREDLDPEWLIVFFHHPPYSWSAHGDDAAVKELWVPLLETYQVDLVITGHEHVYQRSHPSIGGVPLQTGEELRAREGVTYVVTGGGGRSLYDVKPEPYPPWLASAAETHHVVVLDITNDTLSLQAIEADNGTVIDSFTIHRATSPGYPAPSEAAAPAKDSPVGVLVPGAAVVVGALARRLDRTLK